MSSKITCSCFKIQPDRLYRLQQWLFWLLVAILTLGVINEVSARQWKLEKHGEQYQISVQGVEHDRLVLSHEGENSRLMLMTADGHEQPDNSRILQFWFDDDNSIIETGLTRLSRQTYLIQLNSTQKNAIIKQMINGIKFHIRYLLNEHTYREITFSLIGFTAVLNDLLIAHEIGHLDPEWMNENHKSQELMCYYAANFSVLAMLHRKSGLSYQQSISKLKERHTEALDEVISDVVKQVYTMPRARLPRDPRGDKFGIFQRCMERFQQEEAG